MGESRGGEIGRGISGKPSYFLHAVKDRRHRRRGNENRGAVRAAPPPPHGARTKEELAFSDEAQLDEARRDRMEEDHLELHRERVKSLMQKYLDGPGALELSQVTENMAHWKTLDFESVLGNGSKNNNDGGSGGSSGEAENSAPKERQEEENEGNESSSGNGSGSDSLQTRKRKKAREIFDTYDSDGSGAIDRDEMKNLLRDMCIPMTDSQLDELITDMDADNSGEIDWDEFWVWYDKSAAAAQREAMAATAGLLVSKLYNSVMGTRLRQEASRIIIAHAQYRIETVERRSFRSMRPPAHECPECGSTFTTEKLLNGHLSQAVDLHAQIDEEGRRRAWRFLPVSCLLDTDLTIQGAAEGFPHRSVTVTQQRRARLRRISFDGRLYALYPEIAGANKCESGEGGEGSSAADPAAARSDKLLSHREVPRLRDPQDERGSQIRRGQAVESWDPTNQMTKLASCATKGGLSPPNRSAMHKGWAGPRPFTSSGSVGGSRLEGALLSLLHLRKGVPKGSTFRIPNTCDGRAEIRFLLPGTSTGATYIIGDFNEWIREAMADHRGTIENPLVGHEAVRRLAPGMYLYYYIRDGKRVIDETTAHIPKGGWQGSPDSGPFNVIFIEWPQLGGIGGTSDDCEGKAPQQHCKKIDLGGARIFDDGTAALARMLTNPSSLQALMLQSNSISSTGVSWLAKSFKRGHDLRILDLSSNGIGAQGAENLAAGIKRLPFLSSLNLSYNQLGDDGAEALSRGIIHHPCIRRLLLCGNDIHSDGAKALGRMLLENCTLETLSVSYNGLLHHDAAYFAESLRRNAQLTELDLGHNTIGPFGLQGLSEMIEFNDSLLKLGLAGCQAQKGGVKVGIFYFCRALRKNHSLLDIDLSYNHFDDYGAQELTQALVASTSVVSMNLTGNQFSGDWLKQQGTIYREGLGVLPSIARALEKNQARDPRSSALSRRLAKEEAAKARKMARSLAMKSEQGSKQDPVAADAPVSSTPALSTDSTEDEKQSRKEDSVDLLLCKQADKPEGYWTSRRAWRPSKSRRAAREDEQREDSEIGGHDREYGTERKTSLPCLAPSRPSSSSEGEETFLRILSSMFRKSGYFLLPLCEGGKGDDMPILRVDEEALLEKCLISPQTLTPAELGWASLRTDLATFPKEEHGDFEPKRAALRTATHLREKKKWAATALPKFLEAFEHVDILGSGVILAQELDDLILILQLPIRDNAENMAELKRELIDASLRDSESRARRAATGLFCKDFASSPVVSLKALWEWYRDYSFSVKKVSRTAELKDMLQTYNESRSLSVARKVARIVEDRRNTSGKRIESFLQEPPVYLCWRCGGESSFKSSRKLLEHEKDDLFHMTYDKVLERFNYFAEMHATCWRTSRPKEEIFPDYFYITRSMGRDMELTVYEEPDTDSRPWGIVTYDMVLEGTELQDDWMRVNYSGHRGLWVQVKHSKNKRKKVLERIALSLNQGNGSSSGSSQRWLPNFLMQSVGLVKPQLPAPPLSAAEVNFSPYVVRFPSRGVPYTLSPSTPATAELKVRNLPSAAAAVLGSFSSHQIIIGYALAGDWLQVRYDEYAAAWLLLRYQGKELVRPAYEYADRMLTTQESPMDIN